MKEKILKILQTVKASLPTWEYAILVKQMEGDRTKLLNPEQFIRSDAERPHGPVKAPIVFIGDELQPIEKARREPLTGPVAKLFKELYLDPLSLNRHDVLLMTYSEEYLKQDLEEYSPALVVALGSRVKRALGSCDFCLPHPNLIRKTGNTKEVCRKVKQIKKKLDRLSTPGKTDSNESTAKSELVHKLNETADQKLAGATSEKRSNVEGEFVRIDKANIEKQIVYGVVTDPYAIKGLLIDAHGDWISPKAIEEDAHQFSKSERVIGLQHIQKADAQLIESHVEQYPTPEDYKKAMSGEPHSVWRRPFGEDVVHSGSWVVGVQLGDKEWDLYKQGKITAFSPGGSGTREELTPEKMPEVTFIDLKEVPDA